MVMKTRFALVLWIAALVAAPAHAAEDAGVGLIVLVDTYDGFLLVDFPTGRRVVSVDRREAQRYLPGERIRLDPLGHPVPPGNSFPGKGVSPGQKG